MQGFISGIADGGIVSYCPICGADVDEFFCDGTCRCRECDTRFAVIECEQEE